MPLLDKRPRGAQVQFPYRPELAAFVCFEVATGRKLSEIAKRHGLPSDVTIYEWLVNEPEFAEAYTRAREIRAHRMFEQLQDLADTATNENAAAVRIQVETRRWMLAKMVPKSYGDKMTLEGNLTLSLEQLVLKSLTRQSDEAPKTIEHGSSDGISPASGDEGEQ